jgi:uncharacterized protein YifN (PemK superfamily)
LEPKAGLVIRYDFLWRREHAVGAEHGSKDRPSAVVMVVRAKEDGRRRVVVCPITHTPPAGGQSAVEIPTKLARHLGLDDQKMWIKTDAVNLLDWEVGKFLLRLYQVTVIETHIDRFRGPSGRSGSAGGTGTVKLSRRHRGATETTEFGA